MNKLINLINLDSINSLAALRLFRLILFSLSYIYLTKIYDIEEVGFFNLNLSLVALATTFICLGLNPLMTRLLSKYPKVIPGLIFQIIFIKTMLAFIVLSLLSLYLIFSESTSIIPMTLVLIFAASLAGLDFVFELEGVERKNYIRYQFCNLIFIFILRIGLITFEYELKILFISYILEYFITIIISYKFLHLKVKSPLIKFRTGMTIVRASFPVLLSSFVTIAIWRVDQFCLIILTDAKHVAVQGTLILVYDAIWLVIVTLLNNRFSLFVKKEKFQSSLFLIDGIKFAVIFSPVLVVLMIILLLILGSEFNIGLMSAPVYGLVIIAHAYDFLFNRILIYLKRSYAILINHIFILILNIPLNIILIPEYGIQGSAFASLMSITIVYLFSSVWHFKKMEW